MKYGKEETKKEIKAEEPKTNSEERKAFPKELIDAYLKISKAKWEDDDLYELYRKQVIKYLGEEKAKDRIESGKVTVLLCRATSDLRDEQTQSKKKKKKVRTKKASKEKA